MIELFTKWAVPIVIGFLLGLLATVWVDPQTPGGAILILATSIGLAIVVAAAADFAKSMRRQALPEQVDSRGDKRSIQHDVSEAAAKPVAEPGNNVAAVSSSTTRRQESKRARTPKR